MLCWLVPPRRNPNWIGVRALQHALYRAAKADPGRRFHSLWDKILRRDVLERAWENVRRNGGAAGIDADHHHRCPGVRGLPASGRGDCGVEGGSLASATGSPGVHSESPVRRSKGRSRFLLSRTGLCRLR